MRKEQEVFMLSPGVGQDSGPNAFAATIVHHAQGHNMSSHSIVMGTLWMMMMVPHFKEVSGRSKVA